MDRDLAWVQCDLYCGEGYHFDPNEVCSCIPNEPTSNLPLILTIVGLSVIVGVIVFIIISKNKKHNHKKGRK